MRNALIALLYFAFSNNLFAQMNTLDMVDNYTSLHKKEKNNLIYIGKDSSDTKYFYTIN